MASRQSESIKKIRAEKRAKGYLMLPERWVHPDDYYRVLDEIERLNKQREREE